MLDLIGLMARLLPSAKWPKIWCVLGPKYFIEIGPWKFKKIRHAYPHRYAIEEKLTSSHLIGSSWWGSSRQHYWQSHVSRGGLFKQFRHDLISRRLKLKLKRRTKTDSVITTLQDKRASLRNARTAVKEWREFIPWANVIKKYVRQTQKCVFQIWDCIVFKNPHDDCYRRMSRHGSHAEESYF